MTFNDLQAAVTISHTPHTHVVLFHRPQKWGVEKWPFPLRTNDTWGLTKTLPVNTGWALGGRSPLLIRAAQLAQNVCRHLLERMLIMQLHSYSGVWTLDLWKKNKVKSSWSSSVTEFFLSCKITAETWPLSGQGQEFYELEVCMMCWEIVELWKKVLFQDFQRYIWLEDKCS